MSDSKVVITILLPSKPSNNSINLFQFILIIHISDGYRGVGCAGIT